MGVNRNSLSIGELVQIEVESLNYSAHAVGRADGLVVFVGGGVPGDRLLVKITQIRKNYAIAEMVEIISASPSRCNPPCVHFIEGCGGCQWQHIAYEFQIWWKKEIVRQALKRIGKMEDIPEIETSETLPSLHYRSKLRLFPSEPSSEKGGVEFGMRRTGSHEVVPIRECLISSHLINSLKPLFRGEVISSGSVLNEISIRVSDRHQQIMLSCTYDGDDSATAEDIDRLSRLPAVTSVFYRVASNAGRSGKFILGYGNCAISEEVRGIEYKIGPECFFQVNTFGLKTLVDLVSEFAGEDNQIVLDAHCGVGMFALQMARVSRDVWGTDVSQSAVKLARSNAADNGMDNVHFRTGTVSQLLRDKLWDVPVDTAILDPPRKGCEKADLQSLISSRPGKVVYVSCNPTTLARDLRDLKNAGYKLLRLAMVDMFPMTYHLETVALCARTGLTM